MAPTPGKTSHSASRRGPRRLRERAQARVRTPRTRRGRAEHEAQDPFQLVGRNPRAGIGDLDPSIVSAWTTTDTGCPPPWSRALPMRLSSACWSRGGSASTSGLPGFAVSSTAPPRSFAAATTSTDEANWIDGLEPYRRDGGVRDDPLDPTTGERHQTDQGSARLTAEIWPRRGSRRSPTVRRPGCAPRGREGRAVPVEARVSHPASRHPIEGPTGRFRRTGSLDALYRSTSGRRAAVPAFPATINALRCSQRPSFRGT